MISIEYLAVVVLILTAGVVYFTYTHARSKRQIDNMAERLSILPEHFVVVDLETTGLDPLRHEIIEIGAIRVNRDSVRHQTFHCFIKPTQKVPKKITKLTGITQAIVDEKGDPIEAGLRQFADFAGDLRIVTFNAEFDMAFLRHAGAQFGLTFANPVSCALKMARRAWPGRRSYRLADLSADGGLDTTDSHHAIGDCRRALIVYTGAVSRLGTLH